MNMNDVFGAGEEILDAVNDAARRGDYSGLSDSIRGTVNRTVGQFRQDFYNPADRYKEVRYHNPAEEYGGYNKNQNNKQPFYQYHPQEEPQSRSRKYEPPVVVGRPGGKVSGAVELGFGIAGTVVFGAMTIVGAVLSGFFLLPGILVAAIMGLGAGYSIWHIIKGEKTIQLVKRFKRYISYIGNRSYIEIKELSEKEGQEKKQVIRDLKKMIKRGMFPQGKLDAEQTTFMLTQEVYDQYLEAERQKELREENKRKVGEEAQNRSKEIDDSDFSPEVKKILKEGNEYILLVHRCNDDIPGEEMSDKLDHLESIMKRIFDQVRSHPETAESLRKFMTYYLPTTKKLLEAYIDLDRQPEAGENIKHTKREIEESLDVINEAFESLLDGMFQDTAWDISSDISVMKTMMAQEGLTGKNK